VGRYQKETEPTKTEQTRMSPEREELKVYRHRRRQVGTRIRAQQQFIPRLQAEGT
jgi:hypothetical protein